MVTDRSTVLACKVLVTAGAVVVNVMAGRVDADIVINLVVDSTTVDGANVEVCVIAEAVF